MNPGIKGFELQGTYPFWLRLFFLAGGLFLISFQAYTQPENRFQEGQLFVKLRAEIAEDFDWKASQNDSSSPELPQSLESLIEDYEVYRIESPFFLEYGGLDQTLLFKFRKVDETGQLIEALSGLPEVAYAERVPAHELFYQPNDLLNRQWNLQKINAESAWDVSRGSGNVTVAIVDDAVATGHQDLSPIIWTNRDEVPGNGVDDDGNGYVDDVNGWDAADRDNDPTPPAKANANVFSHGTHCAGIAAAATDNSNGIASIGFGVSIMPVKTKLDNSSGGSLQRTYAGVQYAIANDADVISMSWGGGGRSRTHQTLMNAAHNQGITLVAAAGNSNTSVPMYPAAYNHVISVGATDRNDNKAGFSNFGGSVDLMAPGVRIYSTVAGGNQNNYANQSGTSMACPLVSGLSGLMLSRNGAMTPDDIERCLKSTAVDISNQNPQFQGQLGAGRIDAHQALQCIAPITADFSASSYGICPGQRIQFTDESTNNPTSWQWIFPGGNPSTSNKQNPTVTYSNPGKYDVTLIASNSDGTDTLTLQQQVSVANPSAKLSGGGTITQGASSLLKVSFHGEPPYDFTYTNGRTQTKVNTTRNPYYFTVTPSKDATYSLVSMSDANCKGTVQGQAAIFVQDADTTNCIVIQAGPNQTEDATVQEFRPNKTRGSRCFININEWTFGGTPGAKRSLLAFDLSAVPNNIQVTSAELSLYFHACTNYDVTHSKLDGSNASWIRRATQPWDEPSVTWNTQPNATTQDQGEIPATTADSQDRENLDITNIVTGWLNGTYPNHGLLLRLKKEDYYRRMAFASSENNEPSRWPALRICFRDTTEPPCQTIIPDFKAMPACAGDSIRFADLSVDTGQSNIAYREWAFGDGDTVRGVENPSHRYNTADTYQVTLTLYNDDSTRCIDSITKAVTVPDQLTVRLNNEPDTICRGDSIQLAPALLCGQRDYDFQWRPAKALSSDTVQNPMVYPNKDTPYRLIVTDAGGRKDTAYQRVVVDQSCCKTYARIGNWQESYCQGDSLKLTNASDGKIGASYQWFFRNGLSPAGSQSQNPPKIPLPKDGLYKVTLTLDDRCGQDTTTKPIRVYPSPASNYQTVAGCLGDTVQVGTAPVSDRAYRWMPGQALTDSTIADPLFVADQSDTLYRTVSDEVSGCSSTDTTIVKLDSLNASMLALGPDTTLCKGDQLRLSADIPNGNYTWQDGDSGRFYVADTMGTYWVKAKNACGRLSDTINISTRALPEALLGFNDTTFCPDDSLELSPQTKARTFRWQDGSTDSTYQVYRAGTYWVKARTRCGLVTDTAFVRAFKKPVLNLKDTAICAGATPILSTGLDRAYTHEWQDSVKGKTFEAPDTGLYWVAVRGDCYNVKDTLRVKYRAKPTVQLPADSVICPNQQVTLKPETTNVTRFSWQNQSLRSTLKVRRPGTYWVRVENSCGAEASDTVQLRNCVEAADLEIPNVFTPNGDGKNDRFFVQSDYELPGFELWIVNRWGQKVFSTNDRQAKWDGTTPAGKEASAGTYYYRVVYGIKDKQKVTGTVTLIR